MFNINLKKLREEMGISQEKFGELIGISKSTIGMYEQGNREPRYDILLKIASVFGVSIDFLLGYETQPIKKIDLDKLGISIPQPCEYPSLGQISCGLPILCNENREIFVSSGDDVNADFCLKARGDSMINAQIFDGDTIFIKRQSIVDNGEIAAVIINDEEVTLKRFYYYKDKAQLVLQPENPIYSPQVYNGDELNHIIVLGKAVAVTHYLG